MSETTSVKEAAERTAAVSFTELNARRLGPIRRYFRNHPRVMDAVVVFAYLAASLPNAIMAIVSSGQWLVLVPLLGAAAVLFFRRDRPLLALGLLLAAEPFALAASGGQVSVGIAIWFALYSVAVARPLRTAFWALGGSVVLSIAPLGLASELLAEQDTPGLIWLIIGFILMWYTIAVGVGATIRRDRLHETELREWADRNADLASATERNRIAREMHDVVAHSLSVMVALSDGAAVVLKRDPTRAGEVLGELSSTGRTALADMRRVLGVLREGPGAAPRDPLPVSRSLSALVEGFRAAGLPVRVVLAGPGLPADPAFELTVHRIVQESLTNVLRYGKSVTTAEVAIERNGRMVRIRVSDDGRGSMGPVVSVGSGQGIAGMRERAAIYGGTVDCGPGPNGGWVVKAALVIPEGQGNP